MVLEDTLELKAIPIVGMTGIGKTTLVQQIYEDIDVTINYGSHLFLQIGPHYYASLPNEWSYEVSCRVGWCMGCSAVDSAANT